MIILGIETSCDETAAAVVKNGQIALSNVIVSQVDLHREYGGVVPELASRKHIECVSAVITEAMKDARLGFAEIDAICVTSRPGLVGALLVGVGVAKGIAMALDKPICGVNHLHGHLFAASLETECLQYPFIGMVVSGGHTSLFNVRSPLDIELIGKTRDDAAGEAYDKVAKLLGLGYPGGAIIEQLAYGIPENGLRFPRALLEEGNLDFSFSGLKTAVLRHTEKVFGVQPHRSRPGSFHPIVPVNWSDADQLEIRRIASAFQAAVIDVLATKLFMASRIFEVPRVIVCGGVACNMALRERVHAQGQDLGIDVIFPSPPLCADNAAMIGAQGYYLVKAGRLDSLDFSATSR